MMGERDSSIISVRQFWGANIGAQIDPTGPSHACQDW